MKNKHLTSGDFRCAAWQNLERVVDDRLEELRGQLETLDATPQATDSIRGRISELRGLMALAKAGKVAKPVRTDRIVFQESPSSDY